AGQIQALAYWEKEDLFLASYGLGSFAHNLNPGRVATLLSGTWGSPTLPYAFPYALAFTGTSPSCGTACPPAPSVRCAAAPKSQLMIKDKDADGAGPGDRLTWKWLAGPAIDQADFGDPTATA